MNEYLTAYNMPFIWARNAFNSILSEDTSSNVSIQDSDLNKNILDSLSVYVKDINSASDWNQTTSQLVSDIAGIYVSISKLDDYTNTLRQKLLARIEEGEKKLRSLEASIRSVRTVLANSATNTISISGGDTSWVDLNSKYYTNSDPLQFVSEEGCYRLPDTGWFSAIRSNNAMGGYAAIEKTLTPLEQVGTISNITDGSRESYWLASSYLPSLVKASSGSIPWLPAQYTQGSAVLLSYFMDRPTIVGEVYLDPLTTESFTLLGVSWTPQTIQNALNTPLFNASSRWAYSGTAYRDTVNNLGVILAPTGLISQTFGINNAISTSLSGSVASGSITVGQRFELYYSAKTIGDVPLTLGFTWLDSLGAEISTTRQQQTLANFYQSFKFSDYAPQNAVSGKINFYINSLTSGCTAFINKVELFAGEEKWVCNQRIDNTTTIPLPKVITSQRVSFTLTQTSPRRETLKNQAQKTDIFSDFVPDYIDSTLVSAIELAREQELNSGPGHVVFAYKFGLRELDLRYREYVPRGSLTSIPLLTRKEIRSLWISADVDPLYSSGIGFNVIPFDKDDTFKVPLKAYKVSQEDSSGQNVYSEGSVLNIFTAEEEAAGWARGTGLKIVTEPIKLKEVFDGTDREGKVVLDKVPHTRRVQIRRINEWFGLYSLWPNFFDPNSETINGITSSVLKENIRNGSLTSTISQGDVASSNGYLPIKVTVSTAKWTASQDIYGKPDTVTLRSIDQEVLNETEIVTTSVESDADYVTLDQYMAVLKMSDFVSKYPTTIGSLTLTSSRLTGTVLATRSVKEVLDILKSNNINQFVEELNFNSSNFLKELTLKNRIKTQLRNAGNTSNLVNNITRLINQDYDNLKANKQLPKTRDVVTSKTTTVKESNAYKTEFSPIVAGESGSLFKLYWFNSEDGSKLIISPNDYKLNSNNGTVIIRIPKPENYDKVIASYKYINKVDENSQFADILSLVNTESTSEDVIIGSKYFPVCRNMTNYITGEVPNMKKPNFDTLSTEYYPVIEYYITPDGDIIFSRDFFTYGDLPAKISVEYETLGVAPRVEVSVVRSSGAHTTPKLSGFNLRTKEGSAAPVREGTL
jgi:hypothetical protein